MSKLAFYILFFLSFLLISCEKEYACVCTNTTSGEKEYKDRVKTTKLGKKGFESSCKSNESSNTELTDCHVE